MEKLGLSRTDAMVIAENVERAAFFDDCVNCGQGSPAGIAKWVLGEVAKYQNETGKQIAETALTSKQLAYLVLLIEDGKISTAAAKTIFEEIIVTGADIDTMIHEKGLAQVSDTAALEQIADTVLAANAKSVADYKGGKTNALGFLVGQCMKASRGKANPGLMKEIVLKKIEQAE